MHLRFFYLTFLLFSFSAFSQTSFTPGYLIKTNGVKVNCFIKNEDWRGSPRTFEYKLEENGEIKIGTIDNIDEFGAGKFFKYIKATVEIDQSSDKVGNLNDVRNPVLKEETLFLKTLAEGNASLYTTEKENKKYFFFKIESEKIQPLIYKKYMATPTRMGTNEYYKQQLATTLNCDNLLESHFENLEYKKNKLLRIIVDYNSCKNSETILYVKENHKSTFNLCIRPGATYTSFSLQQIGDEKIDFGNKAGFRIGLEVEYILPFNNNKWSLFFEPTYQYYDSEKEVVYVDYYSFQKTTLISVEYNSIELPLGGRYYLFPNKNSAFFIDAAILIDVPIMDSKIVSSNESSYDLNIKNRTALAFGIGFKFKNKYSLQARFYTTSSLIDYYYRDSEYKTFSLIAGYNFL